MILFEERKSVAALHALSVSEGMQAACISVYLRRSGLLAMNPDANAPLLAADIAVLAPDGDLIEGERKPFPHLTLHLAVYRARPDLSAIVTACPIHSAAAACTGRDLTAIHTLSAALGGGIRCSAAAALAQTGEACAAALGAGQACLVRNFGLLAAGADAPQAYAHAKTVEYLARLDFLLRGPGEPCAIGPEQIEQLSQLYSQE